MVDRIQLVVGVHDDFKNYISDEDNEPIYYFDLHDINILVGANNSGKSRFMRAFLKTGRFLFSDTLIWLKQILIDSIKLRSNYKQFLNADEQRSLQEMISNLQETTKFIEQQFNQNLNRVRELWSNQNSNPYRHTNLSISTFDLSLMDKEAINGLLQNISEKQNLIYSRPSFHPTEITKKIYIPILRSALSIKGDSNFTKNLILELYGKSNVKDLVAQSIFSRRADSEIFINSIQALYQVGNENNTEVFTGLELLEKVVKARNSQETERKKFEAFENFLSKTFFNGARLEILSSLDENCSPVNLMIYLNGEERPIQNLGDGIQSLIILLHPVFMAEENTWIFIEEPETNLHPAFQRIFLETISNHKDIKDKKLKFFFTTHSNHLLDLSFEQGDSKIAIYQFEKSSQEIDNSQEPKFRIRKTEPKDIALLNCLGVHNSSVFLANCSIWVEGITDRLYLQAYLEAYYDSEDFITKKKTKYLEDSHFAFFEYAGSNLEHYLFHPSDQDDEIEKDIKALSLSNRIFLLADKDSGETKESKHEFLKSLISDNFHYKVTPGKEVENLLSVAILEKVLPELCPKSRLTAESIKEAGLNFDDYKETDTGLASYILGKLKDQLKNNSGIVGSEKTGTFESSYKTKLAKLVHDKAKAKEIKWNDLSPSARALAKEVYEFIDKHNSH